MTSQVHTYYEKEVYSFKDRIIETLLLREDKDMELLNLKTLALWLGYQIKKRKKGGKHQNWKQKTTSLVDSLLFKSDPNKTVKEQLAQLETIKHHIDEKRLIEESDDIANFDPPENIKTIFKQLKGKKLGMQNYYARVIAPQIQNLILDDKNHLNKMLETDSVNGLKFFTIAEIVADKYQRNLMQEIFGRVFRKQGSVSVVMKLEIQEDLYEPPNSLYIYIQDIIFGNKITWMPIDTLKQDGDQIFVEHQGNKLPINQKNIVEAFLSEMFVVPLQTLIPRYIVTVPQDNPNEVLLIKHHYISPEESYEDRSKLRSHPSLRNPLLYFKKYFEQHEFDIDLIKSIVIDKSLYSPFYRALNVMIDLIHDDFMIEVDGRTKRAIVFTARTFKALWNSFHSVILLSNWLEEIIRPMKDTVNLHQIMKRFCPVFNYISTFNASDVRTFRNFVAGFQIENFMTTYIPKPTIIQYNSLFTGFNEQSNQQYADRQEIYAKVFEPIISQLDLTSYDISQVAYLLSFTCKFITKLNPEQLPKSWSSRKVWKKMYKNLETEKLEDLDFYLDMMGYHVGVETAQITEHPFDLIRNQKEDLWFLKKLKNFVQLLREKYEKGAQPLLSLILQKCLKYNKLSSAQIMLNLGARISDYSEIFEQQILDNEVEQKRMNLLKKLKDQNPEIYRRYVWERLMRVDLQVAKQGFMPLQTTDFSKCWVDAEIYNSLFGDEFECLPLNVSRKDYMYGTKDITKITLRDGVDYYIEKSEYPMVPKFYKCALERLGLMHLLPNYTLIINDRGVFKISECIPQAVTFEKCLDSYPEKDIKLFLSQNLLSEGILISMIFMPTRLLLRDLIIKPSYQDVTLFVLNLKEFYQRAAITKEGGEFVLKCRNCFFLMDSMHTSISNDVMRKYIDIDIMTYLTELFQELAQITARMTQFKKKHNFKSQNHQLLGMIFQKQFITEVCKRMFKIRTAFAHTLQNHSSLSHMELLQIIEPELSYFYEQIISSSNSLVEREKILMDDTWTKPFIKKKSLFAFVACSSQVEQPLNKFPNHYKSFCFSGPSESLVYLNENKTKFKVFEDNFLKSNWQQNSIETIEFYLENVFTKYMKKEQKEPFFEKIKEISVQYLKQNSYFLPLKYIKINSMEFVKEHRALLSAFSYERVKCLVFDECKFSTSTFASLTTKIQNINYLKLKDIETIQYLGLTTLQGNSLEIKNLKTLFITGCHSLTYIDLKCDILESLVVRNNKELKNIYIVSNNLKTMNCSLNPKLNLENIAIYILRGVNVLLCKTTAYGDAKKLYDDDYDIYLSKILKFLFSRFDDQEVKNNVFVTLAKLKQLQEGLITWASNSSVISNWVSKYSSSAEETVLIRLIELFLQNPYVEGLYINQLVSNDSKLFTIFNKALEKHNKNRAYKHVWLHSLHFKGSDECYEIFKKLSFDKNMSITIENIEEQNEQQDTRLLKVFVEEHKMIQKLCVDVKDSKITTDFLVNLFVPTEDAEQQPAKGKKQEKKETKEKKNLTTENQKQIQKPKVAKESQSFKLLNKAPKLRRSMSQEDEQKLHKVLSKVNKLHFQNSALLAQLLPIYTCKHIKDCTISSCTINNFTMLQTFESLKGLSISNTEILSTPQTIYETLAELKQLETFAFTSQRSKVPDLDLQFLLNSLSINIKSVDLSENHLTLQGAKSLNQYLRNKGKNLHTLILKNFYSFEDEHKEQLFKEFLKQTFLKCLHIQIKGEQQFRDFVAVMVQNTTIVKLVLNTHFTLSSKILTPLNENKTLEQIQSRQLLPMWLKRHLEKILKSKIQESQRTEQVMLSAKTTEYFKVGLSLDGGGTRGVLLGTQLEYIEKAIGQPIYKIFDYVGGTSIGGILTLASTGSLDGYHPICYAKDLTQIFYQFGQVIFPKSQMKNFVSLFDTKYSPSGVQSVLKNYFKDCKMSDVLPQTNAVVTAVSRIDNRDAIFKSMEAILHRDKDFYMRDVGRATSAAPTYFPSAQIKNIDATVKLSLMDGGMGLNNPSKLVLDEIKKMAFNYGHENNYFLLSLGTGRLMVDAIPENAGIKDLAPIVDSFGESANYFLERDLQDNSKGHFMRVSPQLDRPRREVELDSSDVDLMNYYRDIAYDSAKKHYQNTITFGKYRNMNFIDWLRDNTQKKLDA